MDGAIDASLLWCIIIYQTLSLEEGAVIESTIEVNIEHG
jgi:hypothetical protein